MGQKSCVRPKITAMFPTWMKPSELGWTPLLTHYFWLVEQTTDCWPLYCKYDKDKRPHSSSTNMEMMTKTALTKLPGILSLCVSAASTKAIFIPTLMSFYTVKFKEVVVPFSGIQFRINESLTTTLVASQCVVKIAPGPRWLEEVQI